MTARPQTLSDLLDNRQVPDHARPNVTLGEVRAAIAEAGDRGRREALGDAIRRVEELPAQPYTLSGLDTTTDSRMVNRVAVLQALRDAEGGRGGDNDGDRLS